MKIESKGLNNNYIKLTGNLVGTKDILDKDGNLNIRTSKNEKSKRFGQRYISGSIEIMVEEGHKVKVDLFSFELVNDDKGNPKINDKGVPVVSALFTKYLELPSMVEESPRLTIGMASFDENRFWGSNSQVVSMNKISGRFINSPKANVENESTFKFEGYVVEPVRERLNKDEEILHYETVLAQRSWDNSKPVYVKFIITKDREDIVLGMQEMYQKGMTVAVSGIVKTDHKVNTVTNAETKAFGDTREDVYETDYTNFVITSGDKPEESVEKGAYTPEHIEAFTLIYDTNAHEIEKAAKAKEESGRSVIQETPAKSTGSTQFLI